MANIIAKGEASITINQQETEAQLNFVPNADGLGWDIDAVNKLIGENRLSPPLSPQSLEPFLQKAAKAKTPLSLVIYEGTPVEEPVPEKITWGSLEVPKDIAPYVEETLSAAKAPELYRIKTEKIKRETLVKKPNKLPFLPPKEELVTVWDKKETQEAVQVNPAILETRYGLKGANLGIVVPPKPGKPGKNVFGKPIPPKIPEDSGFHLGQGLSKEKNEVRALLSGIIRIGENWADMVPLAKPAWEVQSGTDGTTLFLKFSPGDARFPVPAAAEVLAAATAKGAV